MQTIRKLILISRPVSWPNTAYPFAAAYLLAGGQLDLTFWIGVIFFLIPYNLMMYGVNDVFDYESDILNPRKGGIEGMREQRAFHPTIMRAVLLTSLPFVIYFLVIGSLVSQLVFAGVVFFVLAYSLKFLRFKERPILDSITSSLHFVGPMLVALSLIGAPIQDWLVYAVAFFLWGMASHAFGAVQDIIPDRKGKISSIATVFGARQTVRFAAVLYAIAIVLIAYVGGWLWAVAVVGCLYVANVWPYINVSDEDSGLTNRGWRRFLWINYLTGAVLTMALIISVR